MLRFFYDSLETVRKLKKPTKKEYINMIIAIIIAIFIGSVFFVGIDTVFHNVYKIFYSLMKA